MTPGIYASTNGFFWPFFTGLIFITFSLICCIIFNIIDKIFERKAYSGIIAPKKHIKFAYFIKGIKKFPLLLWITFLLGAIGYGVQFILIKKLH